AARDRRRVHSRGCRSDAASIRGPPRAPAPRSRTAARSPPAAPWLHPCYGPSFRARRPQWAASRCTDLDAAPSLPGNAGVRNEPGIRIDLVADEPREVGRGPTRGLEALGDEALAQ